jgi:exopolysaccharide biosynthesis protein
MKSSSRPLPHIPSLDPGEKPEPMASRRWVRTTIPLLVLALLLGLGGAGYWALDRFVIDHVEIADVAAYEAAVTGTAVEAVASADAIGTETLTGGSTTAVVTDDSYDNGSTSIAISKVTTGSGADTVTYYVADVVVADATDVRSAFASNEFGTNIVQYTSDIAQDHNAVFAINGDYYGFRNTGILIRNGVIYRNEGARVGLAFYRDGSMAVYDETRTTAEGLVADGVWNTLSFGPALVDDGQVLSGIDSIEIDTNFGNHSIQGTQPRTGVGMIAPNHFVFVVVDGRSRGYSRGVTMTEFARIFADLGCEVAYNLDGGGSATMYFNGELVNNPLGKGRERGTSDILYVAW